MRSSRLSQLYRAQSLINEAVARAADFKILCEQVCRIGVEEGGIACVLVRLHDPATGLLTTVAFSGVHPGFVGRPQLPAHDSQGVSAIAFQTKQPVIVDDMRASPITAHIDSEVAKQWGINSAAAFPLISAGKPIGTFAMFAKGTGSFDAALADLLGQTAAILAFSHEKLQAEAARHQAEERLRLAMSASQSGVWDWDLKTGTSVLSDEYYRMFGYEPGEADGNIDFLMQLVPAENREKTLASLKAQWSSGVARTDYEQRFVCKDGSIKWVQIRATIIRAADGTAERMVGTSFDLTERKERERRILQLSRLNAALGKINAAVARVTDFPTLAADACKIAVEDGGFVSAVIRTLDAGKAHLTQVADFGVRGGFLGLGTIMLAEGRGVTTLAIRQGKPVVIRDLKSDPITRHAAADGQRLGINAGAAFPLSVGGVPIGTMTVWAANERFIDEQHLGLLQQMADAVAFAHAKLVADAALIARERDMQLAQRAGNIGSWIVDLQAGTWTTSKVGFAVFGLPPVDWYPLATFEALLVPEERARVIATVRANIGSGEPRRQDYEIIRPSDGARRWLRLITDTELDLAGKPVRRFGTLQDVTEERAAKQKIERANRLYEALSKISEAVARATDFATLGAIACRIAVEDGGMRTALIRQYNPDTRTLDRLAYFGPTRGRVGMENLSVDDPARLTLDAFRLGHLVLVDSADPRSSALSADAIKLGITAAASYPLSHNDHTFGTFTVFAADVKSFEDETVGLLQKITDAISFSHEKLAAEAALKASRNDLELAQKVGRVGSVITDLQAGKWTTSEVGFAVLGLPPADWYPLATFETMLAPERHIQQMANLQASVASGKPSQYEYEIIRPADGARRWLRVVTDSEFDQDGKAVRRIGTLQDVTEEHVAKQRIERANRLYAALSKTNEAVAHSSNFETLAGSACAITVEQGGLATAVIRLHDAAAKSLRRIAHAGVRFGAIGGEVLPMEPPDGLAVDAFLHGHPVQLSDLNQVQSSLGREAAQAGLTAAVSHPLLDTAGQSIGTFTVYASDVKAFDAETVQLLQELSAALSFAWTKYQADAALFTSRRDLELAQEGGRIGSVIHDVNAGTWTCSEVACQILGLPDIKPRPLAGFLEMLRPASRARAIESNRTRQDAAERSDEVYEITHQQDQKTRWIRLIIAGERHPSGEVLRRIGTVQDVTREHLLARRAMHVSRLYSALSETNAAIVHSPNFAELCREVVRTLVERGSLVSAAIRLLDDDGKLLVEIAGYGPRAGLVARTHIPVDDKRGIALAAFHARKAVLIANMADDPRTVEASAAAADIGITSAAAFPLVAQDNVFGILSVWASDSGWLDDQMSALLAEIAEAVSFARAKLDADARLAASERDLREAQRAGRVGSVSHDLLSDLWTVSEMGAQILGLTGTGPHDMAQWRALFTPELAEPAYTTMRANIARRQQTSQLYCIQRPSDQQMRWVRAQANTEWADDGTPLRRLGTIQDVTDEIASRERIEQLSRLYAALSKTNEAVVRTDGYDTLAADICRIVVEEGRLVSAVLRLYHPETQALVEVAAHGPRTGTLGRPSVPVDSTEGLAAQAFRHGRRIIVTNLDEHPSTRHSQNDTHANGIVAGAAFPLRGHGEPIGTLTLFADRSDAFDDQMAELLGEIADSVAFAHAKMASERARRDADARMTAIIDSAMDALITCDEGLRIVVFNHAAEQMFHITEAEAIGQPLNNLLPERFRADHPRWIKAFGSRSTESRAMGRMAQVHALRGDGTEFPVEASISHTELSGNRFYTVIMRDVTAKLANQRALAETERRYRGLVETSLSSIMLLRGRVIQYANPATARVLGFDDVAEVTGLNVDAVTAPEHLDAVQLEITRMMQQPGQTLDRALLRLQRSDGKLVETMATGTSIDVDGQTLIQLELRDVTRERRALAEVRLLAETLEARVDERTGQLAQANQELAAANRDLESFSYSVAHDLRAPLRAMIGFSQLLEMDLEEGTFDQLPSHTQRISDSAKRMNELIDGLLAVARVTHGALSETEIDCNVLVAEVIASLSVPESVQLAVEHLPVMKGDVPSMRQVWVNLISNAVKYSAKRPQPRIEVGVVRTEAEYWFHVRDNGAGFDAAYAVRLFGVFQRLHSQEQFEGTGVGLAIVRRVIERHGGRVWAEGHPNEGATFYFALPQTRLIDS